MIKRWAPLILAALFFGTLDFTLPKEAPLSASLQSGASTLLVFLFFLSSLLGWGAILARDLRAPFSHRLLFGSGFLSLSIFLFALFGAIGTSFLWPLRALLVVGFAGISLAHLPRPQIKFRLESVAPILAAALFFFVLLRGSFLLNLMADVFSYHLYSPWVWWQDGIMAFSPKHPSAFLASYWEALYLWAFPLFGAEGNRLISVFLFSQILHSTVGFFGSVILSTKIFQRFELPWHWSFLAALFGASIFPLLWTSWLAMNDYGIVLWVLGSVLLLLEGSVIAAGILGGIALGAKFSAIFIVAFLPLSLFFCGLRAKKDFFSVSWKFALGGLLGILPLFARNIWHTGNPLFPLLQNIFGRDKMSETMNLLCFDVLGQGSKAGASFVAHFLELLVSLPFLAAAFLLLAFFLYRKKEPGLRYIFCLATLPVFPAIFWLSSHIHEFLYIRYLSPSLFFATSAPIAALGRQKFSSKYLTALLLLALSTGLLFSKTYIPWPMFFSVHSQADYYERYQSLVGSSCKIWMAEHLPKESRIVSIEDDLLFFFPLKNIEVAFHSIALDKLFLDASSMQEKASELKSRGYDVLYYNTFLEPNYHYQNSLEFHKWLDKQESAQLFRGKDCLVLDFRKMN